MPSNFPTSLDTFRDPAPGDQESDHAEQHGHENDAIAALQRKVGINNSTDPTSLDYLVSHLSGGSTDVTPDWPPPSGSLGYDYEFNAIETTLPTNWTWFNQLASSSYNEAQGVGVLAVPAQSADKFTGIMRAIPSQSSWMAAAKLASISNIGLNRSGMGLFLFDSSTGKSVDIQLNNYTGCEVSEWTGSGGAYSSALYAYGSPQMQPRGYLGIRKNSATSYDFLLSSDGAGYEVVLSAWNPSSFSMTPDHIGVGGGCYNATNKSVHWFRVR